jgi:hypothetical protein
VRPLILMIVDVVGYLAQQNAFRFQHSVSFSQERRIRVGKGISVLL